MKKISKKRIIILILLNIILIIQIKAFTGSRANKITDITAKIVDISGLLSDETQILKAVDEKESGTSITLPSIVNEKQIEKYIVEMQTIEETKNDNNKIIADNTTEQNVQEKELQNTNTQVTEEIKDEEIMKDKQEQEKLPGEKIYLTQEELENAQIELNAIYKTKEIEDQLLYSKVLEKEIDENKIIISGYMPNEAKIEVEKVDSEVVTTKLESYINENTTLKVAYDIKIMIGEKEFDPKELDENVEVTIAGIKTIQNEKYKVIHINKEENAEKIENIQTQEDCIVFSAKEFSTYAVLSETEENAGIMLAEEIGGDGMVTFAQIDSQNIWDGNTTATAFSWGNGTQNEPYLIADGDELAFLANQVNNGTTYEGVYFQLASDINLGNNIWTPIGTTQNSFRGNLDGAGHTIGNARIQVSSLPNQTYESYGIFGSIGGGNTRSVIKNLELTSINIDISASGATGSRQGQDEEGIRIGCLSGTMYRNVNLENIIVSGSTISDSNTIRVYDSPFQFAVGGVVGYITNTATSDANPGTNSRYLINNCYSNVIITLDATATVSSSWFSSSDGRGQYHTGGIVGTIRSQAVWPTNCLYDGTIQANGYIGPIFAALVNNTDTDGISANIWNGNDAGNLNTSNAFYTNYSAAGTTFTQTVKSGNSTARKSNTTSNVGYVQGVNKGSYTTNMTTMLNMFNGNVTTDNKYMTWLYENNVFTFKERLITNKIEPEQYTYEIEIDDPYEVEEYILRWYKNGFEDTTIQGTTYTWIPNYEQDENIVVVTYDGSYYAITKFTIKRIGVDIVFNINSTNNSVKATLEGEGMQYTSVNDYTFQWYSEDISGEGGIIEGATSLTLNNLEEGLDYRLVATNTVIPQLSTENTFTYGDRIVIYVDYKNGNNRNDGYTEETAVQNLGTAYSKLDTNGTRNKNVIVLMGTYNDTSMGFFNSQTATTYAKNATITGKYKNKDYAASLRFGSGNDYYRYLTADLTFQYLTLNGGGTGNSMYFIMQGHSLTFGEQVTMTNYQTANTNQGLLGGRAPAFHVFAGWYQYNRRTLPNNDSKLLIKSGTYGRVVLGGTPGTSSGLNQTTSRNFTGSSMEDSFRVSVTIDIKNSTKAANHDYDVNLLVGGSASGNNYSIVTETIKNGKVGRVLGGSIGDSSSRPNNWNYPINTFLGETTINLLGGTVDELYGGCLGRNMNVVGNANATGNACDSYFYGTVNINIQGGEVTNNIYGAGAGGVTGYSTSSSDPYKAYGEDFETVVNINITGGTILGNIYGGGYGYTEYLNRNVTTADGGALYGDSNIIIDGSPTIRGNIYAAGCGYNFTNKPELAQMFGESNIEIKGTPTIEGQIFGAGQGISGLEEMAKLTGNSNINIESDLSTEIYGGGNISKTEGTTNINIISGNHTEDIYGGGNLGIIDGTTNVNINGGTQNRVFSGGNQAKVTNSIVTVNGGTTNEIYAGGNSANVDTTTTYIKGGEVTTIYGGSNQTGTIQTSLIQTTNGTIGTIYGGNNIGGNTQEANINIKGGTITSAIYGGGNQVDTTKTTVTLQSAENTIPNVFGGGNQAGVSETYIYCNGTNIVNVFGGSNTNGTVEESNIEINSGTLENVYGGNNQGGTTKITNINIVDGIIKNVYGGGEQAASTTSNINTKGGTIDNIYGGGNQAGVTTTNIETKGGKIGTIFGGSNRSGDVTESNVNINDSEDANSIFEIDTVYGGNNQGGTTITSNVTINGGGVNDVYGGGNQAVTNETNVNIEGKVKRYVFGGGNQAGVNTNTNVKLNGAEIGDNVYGGGDEGTVSQNTYVNIKNSKLENSLYAGGNGVSAIVYGNTNLIMEGTTNEVTNNVFGGGNQAATGTEATNNSKSTVNIVGGKIGKNVYGGANTSVVYGTTQTNIGFDTVGNSSLEIGNIEIKGTVFGGGEANASGSEVYDFNFISVTVGIDIQINGNGHSNFSILGSIFGSGNASSTSGTSYITIQNYGTPDAPQKNVSLQRANCATIINSAMSLSGATDRTNEYSGTFFSISRVDQVKLKNNSVLYLCNGANLLTQLDSLVDENGTEQKGTVTIDEETGNIIKNVDNRVYMLEGKNLNIALNEKATLYGKVQGMFFFGLFTNRNNPSTSTGLYHNGYNNGDEITNAGTFVSNSYVMAEHLTNPEHDIKVDGFYTNYNEEGIIKTDYIQPTPDADIYYMWLAGEEMEVKVFPIEMVASKYATLGTYELALSGFADPNIKFAISGFSSGLTNGVSLVNPSEIESIELDENKANTQFGLLMKTGNIGWQTKGETTFLTENGGTYTGTTNYNSDNSGSTPTLNFCFYHSQNLSMKQALGDVKIRFQVMTPIDDLNYKISYIDIDITLSTALFQDDYYEAAITPGQEFELFTTTDTTITNNSTFSVYYSLLLQNFSEKEYSEEFINYNRVLVSRDANNVPYVFPENTKLTMLDMATNQYYYYVVTAQDVQDGKYIYALSDFIGMGSNDKTFDESEMFNEYYMPEQDLVYENFIFHINLADTNISENIIGNSLLMELRDKQNQTIIGVLGIQRESIVYTVYCEEDATIEIGGTINPETIYLGNKINLNVTTSFTQKLIGTKTIYDTQYFDKKLGIKISIYDNNGNRLNNDSLLGINFELDGKIYYPRIDGTTRIKIADKVTDVLAKIKINTENNKTMATGDYKVRIESFGSSDGIYYGLIASDMVELDLKIINSAYGLKVTTSDQAKIVDNKTGQTITGSNSIATTLEYSSSLNNPNIALSLYRRDYSDVISQNYTLVDLKDYVTTNMTPTKREKEYEISTSPLPSATYFLLLKENLVTGTYKLVYKLYDNDIYVGETFEYLIIK